MATTSSTQLKHVNVGGNGHCSVSSFHDGGGVLFCDCGSLTRGVGAIGTCGMDVVDAGDVVETGGSCCVVEAWGGPCFVRRDSCAFRGSRCKAGGWGGTWGMSGGCSGDSGTLGIGPVHCDVAMGLVDPTGGSVCDTVGCGAGGVILIVVECHSVVVGTVPIVHNIALGKQGSSLILDGCGLVWDMCCVICDVADM